MEKDFLIFLCSRYTEADMKVVLGEHHLVYNTGNEIQRGVKIIVKVKLFDLLRICIEQLKQLLTLKMDFITLGSKIIC